MSSWLSSVLGYSSRSWCFQGTIASMQYFTQTKGRHHFPPILICFINFLLLLWRHFKYTLDRFLIHVKVEIFLVLDARSYATSRLLYMAIQTVHPEVQITRQHAICSLTPLQGCRVPKQKQNNITIQHYKRNVGEPNHIAFILFSRA